jgi:hypothetical protein
MVTEVVKWITRKIREWWSPERAQRRRQREEVFVNLLEATNENNRLLAEANRLKKEEMLLVHGWKDTNRGEEVEDEREDEVAQRGVGHGRERSTDLEMGLLTPKKKNPRYAYRYWQANRN